MTREYTLTIKATFSVPADAKEVGEDGIYAFEFPDGTVVQPCAAFERRLENEDELRIEDLTYDQVESLGIEYGGQAIEVLAQPREHHS